MKKKVVAPGLFIFGFLCVQNISCVPTPINKSMTKRDGGSDRGGSDYRYGRDPTSYDLKYDQSSSSSSGDKADFYSRYDSASDDEWRVHKRRHCRVSLRQNLKLEAVITNKESGILKIANIRKKSDCMQECCKRIDSGRWLLGGHLSTGICLVSVDPYRLG